MKKSKILTFSKCLLAFAFSVNGQSEETSTYDMLWSKVSLYENEKNPTVASSVFEVLFISKSLERIGDHAVNISKEIVFMATSRDVRHAPEYKKSALKKEIT